MNKCWNCDFLFLSNTFILLKNTRKDMSDVSDIGPAVQAAVSSSSAGGVLAYTLLSAQHLNALKVYDTLHFKTHTYMSILILA